MNLRFQSLLVFFLFPNAFSKLQKWLQRSSQRYLTQKNLTKATNYAKTIGSVLLNSTGRVMLTTGDLMKSGATYLNNSATPNVHKVVDTVADTIATAINV